MNPVWEEVWRGQPKLRVYWYIGEFWDCLIGWVSLDKGLRFLEPGAGSGRLSYRLSRRGLEGVALDLSRNSVKGIQDLVSTRRVMLHVVRADILHMPFRDSVFDVVFNEGVVEHFQECERVFGEMVRVSRRRGMVVSSVPNLCSFHTLGKLVLSGSAMVSRSYGFERSFSKREFRELFHRVGLEDVAVHGIGFLYGFARYMPRPVFMILYRVYLRIHGTKLGMLLTERFGFQLIGKGEKR